MSTRFFVLMCVFCGVFLLSGRVRAQGALSPEQLAHQSVKVAAVQMMGNWFWQGNDDAPQETVDEVIGYIDRAGQDDVDLIVFPELLLGKFSVPNVSTRRIGEAAVRNDCYVIAGCFEILDGEGSYGNSMLIFDRKDGEVIGRYFKTHAAVGEGPYLYPPQLGDPEGVWEPGPGFPVFDLDFGRIGLLTCYDGYFPEPFRILSLKGAEILVWASAHPGVVEDYIVKTNMHQNYTHMIAVNKSFGAGTCLAQWPNEIKEVIPEREPGYIVTEFPLYPLRWRRASAREFWQRRPEIYGEILGDHPVWKYYKDLPPDPLAPTPHVELTPVAAAQPASVAPPQHEGTPLSPLAIQLKAHWMEGPATLRFPDMLQSSLGCHFSDTYHDWMRPGNQLAPWPAWQHHERSFEYTYAGASADGLGLSASVRSYRDTVILELAVENNTGEALGFVDAGVSLMLDQAPGLRMDGALDSVYTFVNGELMALAETTPRPESMGRTPWVAMRTQAGREAWNGPADTGATWWLAEEVADMNVLVVKSEDGKHLAAMAWDFSPPAMMVNTADSSLRVGPAAKESLAPGAKATWRGRVYFVENDPEALLKQLQRDKALWRRWPKRPEEPQPADQAAAQAR